MPVVLKYLWSPEILRVFKFERPLRGRWNKKNRVFAPLYPQCPCTYILYSWFLLVKSLCASQLGKQHTVPSPSLKKSLWLQGMQCLFCFSSEKQKMFSSIVYGPEWKSFQQLPQNFLFLSCPQYQNVNRGWRWRAEIWLMWHLSFRWYGFHICLCCLTSAQHNNE